MKAPGIPSKDVSVTLKPFSFMRPIVSHLLLKAAPGLQPWTPAQTPARPPHDDPSSRSLAVTPFGNEANFCGPGVTELIPARRGIPSMIVILNKSCILTS